MGDTSDSKLEDQIKNLEFSQGDYVVYDPTGKFNDENELHFKIEIIRSDPNKGLVLDGMICKLVPTGNKVITHAFFPQHPKTGVPIDYFRPQSKYIVS